MVSAFALGCLLSGQESGPLQWSGNDVDGAPVAVPVKGAKATVVLFVAVDCPISNRYAPELARIQGDYGPKGVQFVRVYLDSSFGPADFRQHAAEFKLEMTAVLDLKRELVKLVGATVTPEAAVLDSGGTLRYRGRIDDSYLEHGRLRLESPRRDLRIALDELLADKPVSVPLTPAIGCGIPDGA
jgi:thiol-disulfide isomerase/thioredoxin